MPSRVFARLIATAKNQYKIEKEYMPYNCLHLFSLKAVSIAVVAVSAWLTYCGSMDLPVMLMMDMFSFMIFSSVEAMNNAAHVLEIIDATLSKLKKLKMPMSLIKMGRILS